MITAFAGQAFSAARRTMAAATSGEQAKTRSTKGSSARPVDGDAKGGPLLMHLRRA
jgi:hypothetical protein